VTKVPQAYSFELSMCSDPQCGPHITGKDIHDRPICEIVMDRQQGIEVIAALQALLYVKAVDDD
jgi:hypothetical protein